MGEYRLGMRSGEWRLWFVNGCVRAEGTVVDGTLEGWWVHWWPNGVKRAEGELRRGMQEGPWRYWHRDGSRDSQSTGVYSDDERGEGLGPVAWLSGA